MDSLAFVAAARAAYLVAGDKAEPSRRLFLPIKNNIGVDKGGYGFTIEEHFVTDTIKTSRVVWSKDAVNVLADDAMRADAGEAMGLLEDAQCFLQEVLADGPVSAKDVYSQAGDAGHARRTIRRAQEALAIKPRKVGGKDGKWVWGLPADDVAKVSQDDQRGHQSTLDFAKVISNSTDEDVSF